MDGESSWTALRQSKLKSSRVPRPQCLVYSHSRSEKLDAKVLDHGRLAVAIARLVLLPFCFLAHSPLAAQPASGESFVYRPYVLGNETLRYRMVSGQTIVGEMTVNVMRDDTMGMIHIVESVSGLFERSTAFTLRQEAGLRPVSSHTVFGNDDRFHTVHLKYEAHAVTGQIDQPAEFGGNRVIAVALAPAAQDFFAVPYVLRARALRPQEMITFPIFDFHQVRGVQLRGWVVRKEAVTVPAGEFDCYRVEGFSGKLRWIFLIEENFPHQIVKIGRAHV